MRDRKLTIAVIAPASPPDRAGLERGISLIRSWGHEVIEGKHLSATWRYLAASHDQRLADLLWALQAPGIDVVWIARGGFGIQHALAELPPDSFGDRMVIGSSDATALLQCLHLRGHARLVHGPMVDTLATTVDDATRLQVRALLEHSESPIELTTQGAPAVKTSASGRLVGGNLTMLASMCGTPWKLDANGAILMLEDITEHAFRMDRSLLQLRLSGALAGVRAIVLGEFTRCHLPADADYTASELVADILRPLGVPIASGMAFGHGTTNLAWPYGRLARLEGSTLSISGLSASPST